MNVSLFVYCQMFFWGVLYCLIILPPFFVFALVTGLRKSVYLEPLRRLIVGFGKVMVSLGIYPYIRIRYEDKSGTANVPVQKAIIVLNHRSGSDPFLVAYFPLEKAPVMAVNGWPMRLPFFGFFARKAEYIDVTRQSYEETREQTLKALEQGYSVVAFPEGTRSGSKEMNQFHGTFFRIAKEAGVPIVPIAVAGNEKVPDRQFRMYTGKIIIRRLPAISAEEVQSTALYPLKERVRRALIEETREMDEVLAHEK